MDRTGLLLIVVAIAVVLLSLMALGWRARTRRQRDLPAPVPVPGNTGDPHGEFHGRYVATSVGGEPLERITAHGLAFRGSATVRVSELGVLLDRIGERPIWIPREHLDGVRRATWTIDRVVEQDGLTVLDWRLGDRPVETALRLDDPQAADTILTTLTTGRTTS